ncbi:MAG: NTP transferase domain-containing protein [Gemmatimonadetes bacterium]|nr:NTP transferase domain-containing protein [Gemmatimonadota bacterium]NIO30736.1 NTP transferase domain-containing protein [Gemmatimonadota bacterium]
MSEESRFERWVVLLAGGIGSRFWPASTPRRPKQLLPLASGRPLIVDTMERARALTDASRVLIVAGEHLRSHLESHFPDLAQDQLLLEPQARGTAPALAWAASEIIARAERTEQAVMVSLNTDHVIRPLGDFVSTLELAVEAAGDLGRLLTVGIRPDRPETDYGYIEVGERLTPGVFEVRRFVEKPDKETATGYLARGGFLWNSGMFVWRPQLLLAELDARTPELAGELEHLAEGEVAEFFEHAPTLTIDYGLMERSPNIAVVEAEFEWDDVGAWTALLRVRECDAQGNLLTGDAHAVDCQDSLIWAEDGPVVAYGASDLVIVRASGITFVAPRERALELKQLLADLPEDLRSGDD